MIPVIVTPINPLTSVPSVGISASGISGNAPQVPQTISALPPGTLLQGFVLNRNGAGNPTLRTELGDFLLQSSLFLKIGSNVTVRVDASGQNFRSHILEVDGQKVSAEPKTTTNNPLPQKSADDQIIRSGWIPQTGVNALVGKSAELSAVLLTPNSAATTAQLKEGAALLLRLFNIQLPSNTSSPTNPQPASNTANNPAAPALPNTAGTTNAPSTSSQPTSAQSSSAAVTAATSATTSANSGVPSVGTQAVSSPASSNAPFNPYQNATSTSGTSNAPTTAILQPNTVAELIPKQAMLLTVIGQERDGEPVLQTPFGLIRITSGVTLATGTQLQATLATAAGNNVVLQTPAESAPLAAIAQKWTSLTQILNILTEANEGIIPAQLGAVLPQIQASPTQIQINPSNAGAGIFMFLAALQGGDFRSVLGEKSIKQLERLGHSSLISKAEGEFQMLARLAADAPQQGWQSMFLPVLVNGQVEMMRWFTKRDQEKDKDGKKTMDGMTRFIVEVTMSQLGDIQLDGLFKKQDQLTQFELIIRSHQPLDAEIQQDIQQIYQEAQETTGAKGSIVFQASERFPTLPLEEILGNPPDLFA